MIAASPIDGFLSPSIVLSDLGSSVAGAGGNMPIARLTNDFFYQNLATLAIVTGFLNYR